MNDEYWMQTALSLARRAASVGEVPVGAVLVKDGVVLGEGWNQPLGSRDPSAHAEIVALRQAGLATDNYRLSGSTLYVTIEPCTMCVGAMVHARVERLVFGAREPRSGAVCSHFGLLDAGVYNHQLQWAEGVLAEECAIVMREFFRARR